MSRELSRKQAIERSIIKRFRHELWKPFIAAVQRYELIAEGDRIAVCISGGKDSMLLAKLMQELQRHSRVKFELVYLVMDPGYNPANRARIIENAETLGIDIRIFDSDIFSVSTSIAERNPCYLCARMRRGFLYDRAQELGCNKIALGHHFDDVVETTLIGMFYGGQLQGMLPKLHSRNFPGMELIRPMYCVRERDVIDWCRYNDLHFIRCACRMTEKIEEEGGEHTSKRYEVKMLLKQLSETNPHIADNIFSSLHSVSLDTMVGWNWRGGEKTFLDYYETQGTDCEAD